MSGKLFTSPGEQLSGRNQTLYPFGIWLKIERLSGEKWVTDLPKTHSTWHENPSEKNEVSVKEKNKTLNSSSELQWNKIVLFCAIIRQGCQNWTLRAQRPFWRKFRSKSSFYILFLEFFAKNLNWTHKLRFCQEGILRVQRNISRNIFKEKPKFRAPSEKIPLFGRVYNVRVAKTVFHVSREIFWEKWIFLAKLEIFDFFTFIKNFWILAKSFAKNSNRPLIVQKSISKKPSLEKNTI